MGLQHGRKDIVDLQMKYARFIFPGDKVPPNAEDAAALYNAVWDKGIREGGVIVWRHEPGQAFRQMRIERPVAFLNNALSVLGLSQPQSEVILSMVSADERNRRFTSSRRTRIIEA